MINFNSKSVTRVYVSSDDTFVIEDNDGDITLYMDGIPYCGNGEFSEHGESETFYDANDPFGLINNMYVDKYKIGTEITTKLGDAVVVLNNKYTEAIPYKVEYLKGGETGYLKEEEILSSVID